MNYRFAIANEDYTDFAPGKVIYSLAGATSFPVRLLDEIFLCARHHAGLSRYRVYDPCCGTGYLLTILGLRHSDSIAALYGSDIDEKRTQIALLNMGLLTQSGLEERHNHIQHLWEQYQKQSHFEALQSVQRLTEKISQNVIETHIFTADALASPLQAQKIDLVITDIPYGNKVAWQGTSDASESVRRMLSALAMTLSPDAIIAISSDKSVKIRHDLFKRVEKFQVGHRRITLLSKIS